ncbi:DNA (cytosine-5-)-methyltransferase [Alkalinema sp. FACHB-956]|uniref:DNA cytosine methyltransferase n=1 Tax=Alkalinema sp. FACHB-956 TaxID=2692768 RepID=UPI001682B432|nr:DNA (cytosine-5-)-methyltransferase [Alkalinema sp. FACHB-956]MBD2328331.1 DNA (cytosine-5-)-methyltransferase [Alkalinema sp. FACHB-956]
MNFPVTQWTTRTFGKDAAVSPLTHPLTNPLTCAEYFAGIGLVRLGLERAGWKVVFANDCAPDKFEMYSAFFGEASHHYRVQDIFSVCHSEIPSTVLATASFPCSDLSIAGKLKGIRGPYSSAFWGFTRILRQQVQRPRLVLLENVMGWLIANGGKDFRATIQELNQLGYACDVYAIDAAHFLPQSRPRVFVVGMYVGERGAGNANLGTFIRRSPSLRTLALDRAIVANRDLQWHFLEVPALPERVMTGLSSVVELLSEADDRWWNPTEVQRHLKMMSPLNLDYLRHLQNGPDYSYCAMYRRVRKGHQRAELRKDGLAGCLRTIRGGSSRQMLVRAGQGNIKMRVMTVREYARLQGVPDSYPLPRQSNRALTGFGDAVCVPVITWIAANILNPLVRSMSVHTPVYLP